MQEAAISLFLIAACAVIAPLIAGLIPRRAVPEVVFLLVLGVLIGPHVFALASTGEAIEILRELGLGMLFLLAGYEIEVREVTGKGGRLAALTWLTSLLLALLVIFVLGTLTVISAELVVSIAVTSTALGTLLPILRDNGMLKTPVGAAVLNHGAIGEIGPVVAMAVLLSTRGTLASILVLVFFVAVAAFVSFRASRLRGASTRLLGIMRAGSETSSQTTVRAVLLLLIALGMLTLVLDLDLVLGAFAAGFVLRQAVPDRDERLEHKLDGLAFGFLIPVFFVTSGMAIDPKALVTAPVTLVVFVLLMLLVRGGPVFLASRLTRYPDTGARVFSTRDSVRIGLFGATGLPIIVAVTSVAVSGGQMSASSASLLVAGGAVTVLLLPMIAIRLGARDPVAS